MPPLMRLAALLHPLARRNSRPSRLAVLTALAFLVFNACQRTSPPPGENDTEGPTAVVAYGVDMLGINDLVHRRTAVQSALLNYGLFLPLLEEQGDHDKGPPSFEPRLAESYEFSEDHLGLTFHLRPNVVWSDGVPVTAEDVRWTWQAQTHPDVAWDYVAAKERIRDVEVVDEHTVRFHFTEVYAAQLLDANEGVILPRHAWEKLPFSEWRNQPGWFHQNAVTNGPFLLESWKPQERIVLRRNPLYFEPDLPRLERIVFQIVPDPSSQLALLRSGRAHLDEVEPAEARQVEGQPNLRLLSYAPRQFVFISWNTDGPFFADARVRRALTLGIDRQEIIDTLYYGFARLTPSPYSYDSWVFNRELEPLPHDPERARELLAEAGWTDTDGDGILDKDGQAFSFELLTNNDNQLRMDIQVMIQNQLREVGIAVRPRAIEFNALGVQLYAHDFDAAINSVGIDTSLNLYYNFHSEALNEFNWGAYSNPEVDRVIEEIEEYLDPLEAKPLYDELQRLIHEDQPVTFLYQPLRSVAIRDELQGVEPNALSTFFNMREWYLVEP